jgi:hypothetical protein
MAEVKPSLRKAAPHSSDIALASENADAFSTLAGGVCAGVDPREMLSSSPGGCIAWVFDFAADVLCTSDNAVAAFGLRSTMPLEKALSAVHPDDRNAQRKKPRADEVWG